jgi:Photosynthetic reaction centre cytochrome C subunit
VKCSHCHVEDPQTQKLDYTSDENPRKQTARIMISMLTDINDNYLAQLGGDRRYAVPVTCGSCHQG